MNLFEPSVLGPYTLKNRIVMAPMTRCRCGESRVPTSFVTEYYRQRATAGLIITEATVVTPDGVGYPGTPGIYNDAQVKAWSDVVKAVHAQGGRIFMQLWHCGRSSHPAFFADRKLPVSSSAIAIPGKVYTPEGMQPYPVPRALKLSEIPGLIELFRKGAENALAAGFDGVELHGANGYLPDQFLRDGVNQRTDAYGGSVENRARLMLELTQALISVWGKDRVGVRLSPSGTFNGMSDSNPEKTFGYVVKELDRLGIAYVHITEALSGDLRHGGKGVPTAFFRPLFSRTLIVCGELDQAKGEAKVTAKEADLIAYGTLYISNPDLPKRFQTKAALAKADANTYYAGEGAAGYTDYPAL